MQYRLVLLTIKQNFKHWISVYNKVYYVWQKIVFPNFAPNFPMSFLKKANDCTLKYLDNLAG